MSEADQLAHELEAAIEQINSEVARIDPEAWASVSTAAEGWSVGHTAHHIAEGYTQSRTWIAEAMRSGEPVVLDPAVAIPRVNAENAKCLETHNDESRTDTLAFMQRAGAELVDTVRTLSAAQLDDTLMVVMGEPRQGRLVALPMALRHANTHLTSIRAALDEQRQVFSGERSPGPR
jgi:hypothetical protein